MFQNLEDLHRACLMKQISWHLWFDEGAQQWEFELISPSPDEARLFRKYSDLDRLFADAALFLADGIAASAARRRQAMDRTRREPPQVAVVTIDPDNIDPYLEGILNRKGDNHGSTE